VESYPYPVKEGQRYINLNPGRSHPKRKGIEGLYANTTRYKKYSIFWAINAVTTVNTVEFATAKLYNHCETKCRYTASLQLILYNIMYTKTFCFPIMPFTQWHKGCIVTSYETTLKAQQCNHSWYLIHTF